MSDGSSLARLIWRLGIMCMISKKRIALCVQVDGALGAIFVASPIALQSQCLCGPNEPNMTYGHSWPQPQSVRLQ